MDFSEFFKTRKQKIDPRKIIIKTTGQADPDARDEKEANRKMDDRSEAIYNENKSRSDMKANYEKIFNKIKERKKSESK